MVLNGEAVHKEGNRYYSMNVDTLEAINQLVSDYGRVLISDINGILRNRPRLDFIKKLEKKPIWVDAAPRSSEYVIDLFVSGAERVVIRTRTVATLDEVRKASELSDQLAFQVDVYNGRTVAVSEDIQRRTPRDLFEEAMRMGIKVGLYIEAERSSLNYSITHGFSEDFELFLGMLRKEDRVRYTKAGIQGIVVSAEELI